MSQPPPGASETAKEGLARERKRELGRRSRGRQSSKHLLDLFHFFNLNTHHLTPSNDSSLQKLRTTGYPTTGAAPYYPGGYDPKYAQGPPPNYVPPQGYGGQQQPGMPPPGMYPMQPPPAYGAPPPGQMAPPPGQQQKGGGCLTWLLSCACCCLFFEMCCN